MPTLKDVTKATALLKVGYDKIYKLMEDDQKISDTIEKAETMLKKVPGGKLDGVADTLEDVRIYVLLARDYMYKEYRDISKRSVALILFGALYTISPLDLIPDSFGLLGLVDDAAVLKLVNKMLDGELDKYKEWRKTTGKDAPLVDD